MDRIRIMDVAELGMVLDWAAEEGWNPGLDDAKVFFAADPGGFFLKEVNGQPAAAVSVVNHSPQFAFLGLYICRPDFRGQGHGLDVWNAGLAHADARCIGLDGVPDQQENYARSGFTGHGRTIRYRGGLGGDGDLGARPVKDADLAALRLADTVACGFDRNRFTNNWFRDPGTRRTLVLPETGAHPAFATFRRCRDGVKIGPLHADTHAQAKALLAAIATACNSDRYFIDVPEGSAALSVLLRARGFEPVFETARMFSSAPPVATPPGFHAIASLELG